MYNNAQQCATMYNNVQQCATMYNNVQQCTTMYNNVQQCTTMYNNVQQCTTMYNNVKQCKTVYNNVQQYATMFNNVQQCVIIYVTVCSMCTLSPYPVEFYYHSGQADDCTSISLDSCFIGLVFQITVIIILLHPGKALGSYMRINLHI